MEFVRKLIVIVLLALSTSAWADDYRPVEVFKGNPDAADKPKIEDVRSTPQGYLILGFGFGSDPSQVLITEQDSAVPKSAIAGVSSQRISVLSVPERKVTLTVEVAGLRSQPFEFIYVKPAAPSIPEGSASDEPAAVDGTIVDARTLAAARDNAPQPADTPVESQNEVASSESTPSSNYLEREVMILRKRLEVMEQQIYELRQTIGQQ